MIISFAHPTYLLLLMIIPFFILVHLWTLKNKKKRALSFANFEAIARVKGGDFFSKNLVIFFLSVFINKFNIANLANVNQTVCFCREIPNGAKLRKDMESYKLYKEFGEKLYDI